MHPRYTADEVDYAAHGRASTAHSLSIIVNVPRATPHFLSLFSTSLLYLNIYTEAPLDPIHTLSIFRTFTQLRELRFDSNMEGGASAGTPSEHSENQWFGDALPSALYPSALSQLRLLSLSDQVVPPCFLRRLPANLVKVEYLQRSRSPVTILSVFEKTARGSSALPDGLEEVVVVLDKDQLVELVSEEEEETVKEAFEVRGLRLIVTDEEGEIPKRRLIEVWCVAFVSTVPSPPYSRLYHLADWERRLRGGPGQPRTGRERENRSSSSFRFLLSATA